MSETLAELRDRIVADLSALEEIVDSFSDYAGEFWLAPVIDFHDPEDPLEFKLYLTPADENERHLATFSFRKDFIDYFIEGAAVDDKIRDSEGIEKAKKIAAALRAEADKLEAACE